MPREFRLPDIGEGVAEGEIVKWLVKEGDVLNEDQLMVEVMTDKVTVQIPSPMSGKILSLLAKEGETVKVGSPILLVEGEGAEVPQPQAGSVETRGAISRVTRAQPEARALATPAVRRLARELGVDLSLVRGSGPSGRITEADVRNVGEESAAKRAMTKAIVESYGPEERQPLHGIRKKIAEKMTQSKHRAAHFTYVEEVDVTHLVHLRDRLQETADRKGIKISYLPFMLKALIPPLKQFPMLNASLDDEKQEIVLKKYYNIGVATATDEGLVVPVVRDVDKKDLWGLAREIQRLADDARNKRLKLEDLRGGTFTVTSLGAMGGILATPIINWPEVAILGIHRIEKRPVVVNNQIVIRDMMYISLSFDHRVIDGDVCASFAGELKRLLEHPALLFMEVE